MNAEPPLNPGDLRPIEPADVVSDELVAALDDDAKRGLVERLLKPEYVPWLHD